MRVQRPPPLWGGRNVVDKADMLEPLLVNERTRRSARNRPLTQLQYTPQLEHAGSIERPPRRRRRELVHLSFAWYLDSAVALPVVGADFFWSRAGVIGSTSPLAHRCPSRLSRSLSSSILTGPAMTVPAQPKKPSKSGRRPPREWHLPDEQTLSTLSYTTSSSASTAVASFSTTSNMLLISKTSLIASVTSIQMPCPYQFFFLSGDWAWIGLLIPAWLVHPRS